MIRIKMRLAVLSLSLIVLPSLVFASKALYLPESQRIDWVKETDEAGIYKIYGQFNGKYESKKVRKDELSFAAHGPVDGVTLGWALIYNEPTKTFEHCYVDSLFENGKAFSFCDLKQGERAIRKHYEAHTSQMFGQVEALGSFEKGDEVKMKSDAVGYAKGDVVRIKALFSNNMALILKESVGSRLQGGPYYNAVSKVVSVGDLEE